MAQPTTLLWDRDAHTAAKHDLLRHYLNRWFPILLKSFESATYAEGFAGAGEYSGGEPGSPIIALQSLLDRPELLALGKEVRFVFVEKHKGRYENLRRRVHERWPPATLPPHVKLSGAAGRCEDRLLERLDAAGAWRQPVFSNLDGWGMVPLSIVRRIAQNPASEVLVTFTSQFFVRFAGVDDATTAGADDMFGSRKWRAVKDVPSSQKSRFVVDEYRRVLASVGFPFTLAFEMVDERNNELFIVHGSGHTSGLEKMKEAMWLVDPVYGVRFRDPMDPDQQQLPVAAEPDLAPLRRILLEHLSDGSRRSVKDVRSFALLETMYRKPHTLTVLRQMAKAGELAREPTKGPLVEACYVWRP